MSLEFAEQGVASERIVARLRPHARVLFWPSLILIAGAGALAYFSRTFDEEWQNLLLVGAGSAVLALIWLIPLLRWLASRTVITTRRIVIRRGLSTRTRQELLHSRGYDITVRQRALQSLFRSGDVLINSGLEHPVVLRDVPGAEVVQGALHDLMEQSMNPIAARRQRDASHPNDETTVWGSR
ncbi:PH domain-containing protein [Salinibacterium sp. SYSU T00001]|uniref:PH domain-containing protein n=1 Tax=Homoserinimonas sedimenticola TaxID=2986805 RepID=UPI002235AEC0|nr:PH domain-containing protein [Salinibacterium sedimenticola]MCW4385089.1 PH domain-containing protein [Salinibacterium sedimenticola]